MNTLYLDIQTLSDADLKKYGAAHYSRHESTRAIIISWTQDDEPVFQWTYRELRPMPDFVFERCKDARVQVVFWYADFTMRILEDCLGVRPVTNSLCLNSMLRGTGLPETLKDFFRHSRASGKPLYSHTIDPANGTTGRPRRGDIYHFSQIDVNWYFEDFCGLNRRPFASLHQSWPEYVKTAGRRLRAIKNIYCWLEERRAKQSQSDLI